MRKSKGDCPELDSHGLSSAKLTALALVAVFNLGVINCAESATSCLIRISEFSAESQFVGQGRSGSSHVKDLRFVLNAPGELNTRATNYLRVTNFEGKCYEGSVPGPQFWRKVSIGDGVNAAIDSEHGIDGGNARLDAASVNQTEENLRALTWCDWRKRDLSHSQTRSICLQIGSLIPCVLLFGDSGLERHQVSLFGGIFGLDPGGGSLVHGVVSLPGSGGPLEGRKTGGQQRAHDRQNFTAFDVAPVSWREYMPHPMGAVLAGIVLIIGALFAGTDFPDQKSKGAHTLYVWATLGLLGSGVFISCLGVFILSWFRA